MSMTDQTAIAGVGVTEFSMNSGRSELRLALESITAALEDAGLRPDEVDGLVALGMDNNEQQAIARGLGLQAVRFFALTPYGGGGGCGAVGLASMAISSGAADTVVCFRAMNERSQQRFGTPLGQEGAPTFASGWALETSWTLPYGMATAAGYIGQSARRYMYQYGASSEDFGRVTVAARAFAASNPRARFYQRPITLEDHQESRMMADPLRLLDCCMESDGAVALVVTSAERARDLRHSPALIGAVAQGFGPDQVCMASVYRDDIASAPETAIVAAQLWKQSGLAPTDVDAAIIYDHFTPAVLMQLEALGFCGPGEAPGFVRDGGIGPGGRLPVNPNGGQLGEAYIHGFNGMAEAVRQLRGSAVNQIPGAEVVVVTAGSHTPTSGLILTQDR